MLRKMILLCLVVSITMVGCDGDEPEEEPPSGPPETRSVDYSVQNLIALLDDVEVVPAEIVDVEEASGTCSPPPGGCPVKEGPLCWDEDQCKCIPCS